ncbi:MAG TPA: AAA family ATPase [Chloroflexia bacterium]|nr:AAA family ATPase [Chloroflexia bacterium]
MPTTQSASPLVAIIDMDEQDLMRTMQMLVASNRAQVVGVARKLDEIPHIMTAEPDIVIYDVGKNPSAIPAVLNQILDLSPRCQVILTTDPDTQIDLVRAMQAGARSVLRKPFTADDLVQTISDVFQVEMRRLVRIEEQAKARITQGRAGETIVVYSPKGGVGCTVIATHLALAIALNTKSRVALADFDLQFGDVAVHLNLHSNHSIHELMRSVDDLDGAILDDVMVRHNTGVRVLLPPPTLDLVEDIDTEGLTAVTKALRKYNDFVIVDMWHAIEDATLALMDLADVLLVVTTPEVPALRSTRRFLDYIRERPDRRSKVQLAVNRYPSKSAINLQEIERSLGIKAAGTLPSDGRLITTSINEGVEFLSTRSAAAINMQQLAISLAQPRIVKQQRAETDTRRAPGLARDAQSQA